MSEDPYDRPGHLPSEGTPEHDELAQLYGLAKNLDKTDQKLSPEQDQRLRELTGRGSEEAGGGGLKRSRGADEPEEENESRFYTPGKDPTRKQRSRAALSILKNRKVLVGGSSGIIVSLAVAYFGAIGSGPLEFVHIAQLLDKFHFSSQQDAQDSRLMKVARFIKDPSKPQNTRLGIVGNAVADKLEARITEATGISSKYDSRTGSFEGYTIDREHANFKGKNTNQIIEELATTYGIDKSTIKPIPSSTGPPEITFNPDTGGLNTVKSYLSQTRTARTLLGQSGLSKKASYIGSRVLTQRAGWTFHPIKKLDANIQAAAIKAGKKGIDKLKEQFTTDESSYIEGTITKPGGTPQDKQTKDASGHPVTDPQAVQNKDGVSGVQTATQNENPTDPKTVEDASTSIKAKIAAGGSSLIGVICVLNGINHSIDTERQAKVVVPMMKMAGEAMSVGSQVQSGQDISALQLGFYHDQLHGKDSSGKVTDWNQSESIQAELGHPNTGYDIPKQGQVFNQGAPFDFLSGPLVDTVCGALGSTLGQVFSIVTGPINFIVSGAVLGPVSGFMANWLSGAPISPVAAGADRGNYINYGARAAANQQYASAGGVQLSAASESTLKGTTAVLDNADFQSKSFAYRMFNVNDNQTLAGHLIDNYGSSGAVQGMASMFQNFGSIFSSVLRIPATLLSGITHAAPAQPYDYHGLKKVGFTASELADKQFDNPFDNACYVAGDCKLANGQLVRNTDGILAGPNGSTYIDRASKCFGVKISGDATSGWTTDAATAVNFQDASAYPSTDCQSNDPNWLRVRFWLLDTATIEGYDCYQSDSSTSDQSCTDSGFASSGSTPSSNTPPANTPGTVNGLVNPLSKVSGLTKGRVDQGVDYSGSGPILAMGAGTILSTTNSGWPGGTFIVIKLDGFSDKYVYVAENCQNIKVSVSQHVSAGDELCTLQNAYPNLEIGWANGSSIGSSLASDVWTAHDSTSYYTAYGENFSQLLVKLGAPAGTIDAGAQKLGALQAGWPTW